MPCRRAEGAQQDKRRRLDLINGLRVIHWPVGLVRVVKGNASIAELVHGLSAERLAGVRRIFLAVVLAYPIHDRRDAHKRTFRVGPCLVRREV